MPLKSICTRAGVFVLTVLFALFSACSMKPLDAHVTTTTPDTDASAVPATTVPAVQSEPVGNLNGYVWSLRAPWADKLVPRTGESEADQQLIDLYNEVRTLYNTVIDIDYSVGLTDYLTAAASGVCYADVIGLRIHEIPALASMKAIYSVEEPMLLNAGLNYNDKTRFFPDISSLVRYDDRQWTVQIASQYDLPSFGQVLLCNSTLLEQLGAGNIRNLLETGKWTNAEYLRLAAAAAELSDEEEIFGTGFVSPRAAYLASGGRYVSYSDGEWKNELSGDAALYALNQLYELTDPDNGAYSGSGADAQKLFSEGRLLFLWTSTNTLVSNESLTVPVSALLMPLPSDTPLRQTPVTDYTGYGFMTNNASLVNSVTVFNALALRLNGDWLSAFIEQARLDEDTAEIVQTYILPSLTVTADEYDLRFHQFFDESISAPLFERTETPEAILKNAAPLLDSLIRSLDIPAETGR